MSNSPEIEYTSRMIALIVAMCDELSPTEARRVMARAQSVYNYWTASPPKAPEYPDTPYFNGSEGIKATAATTAQIAPIWLKSGDVECPICGKRTSKRGGWPHLRLAHLNKSDSPAK